METVYSRLRAWRGQTARELNVPTFFVLPNRSVAHLAVARPATLDELSACPGVGPKKLALFGSQVLKLLALCTEDGLEPGVLPPPDAPVQTQPLADLTPDEEGDILRAACRELARRIAPRFRGRFAPAQVEEALARVLEPEPRWQGICGG